MSSVLVRRTSEDTETQGHRDTGRYRDTGRTLCKDGCYAATSKGTPWGHHKGRGKEGASPGGCTEHRSANTLISDF